MRLIKSFNSNSFNSSKIIDAFAENKLNDFHSGKFSHDSALEKIRSRCEDFSLLERNILVKELLSQNKNLDNNSETINNIKLLKKKNSVSITTGHQLNLFGSPMYFLYKILDVLETSKSLSKKYKKYNFVPIFWMASEDHDFNEVNNFKFNDNNMVWRKNTKQSPVGTISNLGLEKIYNDLKILYKTNFLYQDLIELFGYCYLKDISYAESTRLFIHSLFGKYGIVTIDANKKTLKKFFKPTFKNEIKNKIIYECVSSTNNKLKKILNGFKAQANPRVINLFYINNNKRSRIVLDGNIYRTTDNEKKWNKSEIIDEIESSVEKFSPNVLLRPLFQERILPNIVTIGGTSEISYWLQLKSSFDKHKIFFPLLKIRKSLVLLSKKDVIKCKNLDIDFQDFFVDKSSFVNKIVKKYSKINIDFSNQKNNFIKEFIFFREIAKKTDKSFLGAVNAEEKKHIRAIENLENRLLKAQKINLKNEIKRALVLRDKILPNEILQEREAHFSNFIDSKGLNFFIESLNKLFSRIYGDISVVEI